MPIHGSENLYVVNSAVAQSSAVVDGCRCLQRIAVAVSGPGDSDNTLAASRLPADVTLPQSTRHPPTPADDVIRAPGHSPPPLTEPMQSYIDADDASSTISCSTLRTTVAVSVSANRVRVRMADGK